MKGNPYSFPREHEKEGTVKAFAALSSNPQRRAAQERAIRSYVENVIFGGASLQSWCSSKDPGRVALSTWRKHLGTEEKPNVAFRNAIEAYRDALSRGRTEEQVSSMERFRHAVTVALPDAAEAVVGIVGDLSAQDRDRIAAAKALADWSGANKANEQLAANVTVVQKGYTDVSPDLWDDDDGGDTDSPDD